jgi:hypothetical protein
MLSALDSVVPTPRLLETESVDLAVPPERAWELVRSSDFARLPLVHALFALRTLPGRVLHHQEKEEMSLRIDHLVSTPERPGFQILREEPPRDLVVGAIGKVWHVDIPFVHVGSALEFAAFHQPDFAKVAWGLHLAPLGADGTRLTFELRVDAMDDAAWHKFKAYFHLIGPWSRLIRRSLLADIARQTGTPESKEEEHLRAEGRLPRDDWHDIAEGIGGAAIMAAAFLTSFLRGARNHWGVDADTAGRSYPGDDRIPVPRWGWTHGVEIEAKASDVWPWIAQIGADRGGFYSYQWLENVVGCGVSNAESVHPEWEVKEGGEFRLHPRMPPLRVIAVEPGKWFVVHAGTPEAERAKGGPWIETTWLFYLEPLGEDRCRFLSRYRCDTSDDLATRLSFGQATMEPIGFVMDRRMLLGVKERAERVHAPPRP